MNFTVDIKFALVLKLVLVKKWLFSRTWAVTKKHNPPNATLEGHSQYHYCLILRLIKARKRRLAF